MTLRNLYEKSEVFRLAEGGEMRIEAASLFVSGMLLKEILFPDMEFRGYPDYYSLDEMWYLICLHHDKRIEQQRIWKQLCRERRKDGRMLKSERYNMLIDTKWKPLRLCFSPLFQYLGDGVQFTNDACVKKSIFAEDELIDYFHFRNICSEEGGTDHGIVGGLLLYENMVFRHLEEKGTPNKETLNLYSYIANTMMVHNIWESYQKDKIVTPGKDPLLFLLLLAEMIEPLQYRRNNMSHRMLLDAVSVEIFEGKLILCPEPNFFRVSFMEERCEKFSDYVIIKGEKKNETSNICISM